MDQSRFPDGTYLIDFEFHPVGCREGNNPEPVCLVVMNAATKPVSRYWQTQLRAMSQPPFNIGRRALCIAYYAPAEMSCFLALGWPTPTNVIDLFAEFRWLTNGTRTPDGASLLGAQAFFGIPNIGAQLKDEMRTQILTGGPWTATQEREILEYCESDVLAIDQILDRMTPHIDVGHALLRGRYMTAVASIETAGVPLDGPLHRKLKNNWLSIQDELIRRVDLEFGVYVGRTFKLQRWEAYLERSAIPWPRLPSGRLDMKEDTFSGMCASYPELRCLHELRVSISGMRANALHIGDDDRNRTLLSPFRSKTGRNQPSTTKFIFGPSSWLRGLIKPAHGRAIAYIDWSQQEFGIAAALSADQSMLEAYLSGDPYLEFARQAGAVPHYATKRTHGLQRDQFKQCALAVQYGMGAESLALKIRQSVARGRQLIVLHKTTYRQFWRWSDAVVDEATLRGRLWATYGWQLLTLTSDLNPRSLRNFPMQANGAEMLRIACISMTEKELHVCAPVHDAVLIEASIENIDEAVRHAQQSMAIASLAVLPNLELRSDVKIVRFPDRYMDPRGQEMWNLIMPLLNEPAHA